ncbi:hypothetical protein GCM10011289_09080 [Paludibacterium paludis]|uniref:Tetratricopeptide repeat protein n=2 Tax=Paludibacterium paludis TaxID=1225769 RepID=A0A918NZ97_9NEIS|nr:hypothetical protein GCM10011289_09080 [Paludibacterium paludis]
MEEAQKRAREAEANYPRISLTPDIVYGVLASEIAAQRGEAAASASTYLDLAKRTRDPRFAQRSAEFALFTGQLPLALDALKLWTDTEPASDAAREQLLIATLRAGKLDRAAPLIDEILAKEPARAPALFVQLARLAQSQTDKLGTYKLVRPIAARFPDLPEARFAVIAIAAEVNDDAEVERQFDRLATLAPRWDLPVAWQTDRLNRKDSKAALAFLKKELARRPDASMELKIAYPRLLLSQKQYPEARAAFDALLAANPGQRDLQYACGLMAFQMKDLIAARKHLEGALESGHPEQDFLRYTLGQVAEEAHDPKTARRWYDAVGAGPRYLAAQARLAVLDAEEGRIDAAVARLDNLGASDQERTQVTLLQSQLAREAKRYELANAVLTRALKARPASPELLFERGLVADMRGNGADAERDLRAYLKLKPDEPLGLNALGYTLATRTTRYAEAQALIDKALKAMPDNPMILDSMGWLLFRMGKPDAALKYLFRAYSAVEDPEIAAHYGEVLWSLGQRDKATEVLDKAIGANPNHEVLRDVARRLLKRP